MTLNSAAQNVAIADALYLASQDEGWLSPVGAVLVVMVNAARAFLSLLPAV